MNLFPKFNNFRKTSPIPILQVNNEFLDHLINRHIHLVLIDFCRTVIVTAHFLLGHQTLFHINDNHVLRLATRVQSKLQKSYRTCLYWSRANIKLQIYQSAHVSLKINIFFQFWAAYVPCDSQYKDAVQLTLEQIDVIRRLTEMYSPPLTLCTSSEGKSPLLLLLRRRPGSWRERALIEKAAQPYDRLHCEEFVKHFLNKLPDISLRCRERCFTFIRFNYERREDRICVGGASQEIISLSTPAALPLHLDQILD